MSGARARRARIVGAMAAVAAVASPRAGRAQPPAVRADTMRSRTVILRDAGRTAVGRIVRDALAAPHVAVAAPDTGVVFGRRTDSPQSLFVLHGPARLEGRVRGDFIVLGDVVLRPGAVIDGRAIAIGGEILNSTLAVVRGARLTFRDETFAPVSMGADTVELTYRDLGRRPVPVVALTGFRGVEIPTYDRIDGLTVRVGARLTLDTGAVTLDPSIAYRTHLGEVDAALGAAWAAGRATTLAVRAERGTFTNDAWARGDLVNSASSFFGGSDARNYFRSERVDLAASREWSAGGRVLSPSVGVRYERAHSVARDTRATSAPYSVLGRRDREEGMLRPNPAIDPGRLVSLLAGLATTAGDAALAASGSVGVEVALDAPGEGRFGQLTANGRVGFRTFGEQRFDAFAHLVGTAGADTPRQRYAYLGGGGTLPTLRLLEQGGDELVWLESRYTVPITAIRLPLAGSPSVALRHLVGGAGVGGIPSLTQNVGVRLTVALLRVDLVVDPARPSRHEFGFGVGFP